ncbi:putative secreted protein (Por secretion system target) [Chitinophaga skermanii]|uniref:Putative secreted protein (Por secretion system target) n=1 Tax=Chitinophaga skermanii TaxID=331697 RepID=A0A327QXF4_9BACT|nr:M43 family zinc metalloprotease [Chitinophaga skermanii]RAJ08404.1 putative secreted protein (Por secretion system target) [Chitinophaga skermanii]
MRTCTLLIFVFTMMTSALLAQQPRKCGTAEVLDKKLKGSAKLQLAYTELENQLQLKQQQRVLNKSFLREPTVTIPVVVHVVLPNPSVVTDAQILSQIEQLNKDYSATNTDITKVPGVWQGIIGNAGLQFCLAQRTPSGDPTTGITRTVTSASGFDITNSASRVKHNNTGGKDAWDTNKYLNIWVCALNDNYLGVATPPGPAFPASEQGVVVLYTGFGNTGAARAPYNLGRTATHEIGHFFNLRHIWGDDNGACTVDDGVNDTPLQGAENYNCPTFPLTDNCTTTAPGVMFMNYMDYVYDACMYLFTAGQVDRMRSALDVSRASLKTSDGCQPVVLEPNDASISAITQPVGDVCNPAQTPIVTLLNKGSLPLTKVTIKYKIDNGNVISYNWTGNLATMATASVNLAAINATGGAHTITVYSELPNGVADQQTGNDTLTKNFTYLAITSYPYTQDFEAGVIPPADWSIINYDNSYTWQLANTGRNSSRSIMMNNYFYAANDQVDDLLSPRFQGNNDDSVLLYFDLAAAVVSPTSTINNLWDTLEVLVTTDCGQTFIPTGYKKWGASLITRPTPFNGNFVPTSNEWRRDTVNLTPFTKNKDFRVVFRSTANYENNIYLDNIHIVQKEVNKNLREKGILLIPNPFQQTFYIVFYQIPEDLETVAVYDVSGRQVTQKSATELVNNKLTFDLVNAPNGVYFVKLFYKNKVKTYKLVKVQ